jgi:hypothetical protein
LRTRYCHDLSLILHTVENARNITAKENIPLTIGHYLSNLGKLTDQYFDSPENYKDKNRQRVYLKDIDCPPVWQEKLKEHIPASLFYWNDNTGEVGGPGAVDEPIPNGTGRRKGREVAIAGDLMSSLPQEMRAENLMCYIGHEGTYTPAHREMCASLGHNIMVNASEAFDESGQPEKPGSSIWFMTEAKDRHTVQEYWLSVLGHDIETENHFAQVVAWQRAPFKVYVVEQKAGDFILIPPLAPHQVWNRGTRTMKVAWNRTTVETLEKAMTEALPNARMVCRDEQYKNKAIIYYTLLKYSSLLKQARIQASRSQHEAQRISQSRKVRQVQREFKRLFELFKNILISESFAPNTKEQTEMLPFDSNVTCAYCRGNIFNRFLSCKTCMDMLNTGVDEPYDVCMDCYAMGRCCGCQSKYKWMEQWRWKDLVARYDEWRKQIIDIDGGMTGKTPLSLEEERQLYPRRTLAQVCQEQLKMRPWVDVKQSKPEKEDDSEEEEIEVNEDGTVKRMKKKRSKAWLESHKTCHVCCHRHPKWMMAICTMCERGWCYGSLWRAHDQMPQDIMQDLNWECPHCRRVCSTGACRKDTRQRPYEPKGTLLGHDTKKVADVRSVEALVDFSVSNLNWLKETADQVPGESARLKRKKEEAERAKLDDATLNEHYMDEDEDEGIVADGDALGEIEYLPANDFIDPALGGGSGAAWPATQDNFGGTTTMSDINGGANNFDGDTSQYPDPSQLNNGFVAPSALMYRSDIIEDADANQASTSSSKKKRPRPNDIEQIKLVTSKKQKISKDDKPMPKNKASKQFQMQQESKRLEEAKKAGRFIQVMAAIKGRSCIAILKMDKRRLATKLSDLEPSTNVNHSPSYPPAANVLLRSNIAPPKPNGFQAINNPQQPKKQKAFKVRVEDDGDFHSWDRSNRGNKKASAPKQKYEEITVESDEEDFADDEPSANQRKEGRSSQWLARKHQDGDEELPDALPDNFKDGDVNARNRDRDRERRERRKAMPERPPHAQKAPAIRPIMRASMSGGGFDGDNDAPGKKRVGRPPKAIAEAKAMQIAKAAILEAENRKAKLEAGGLVEDDDQAEEEEEEDDEPTAQQPGPARQSIFAKRKNIKIVGAVKPKEKIQVEISDNESSSSGSSSAEDIPANPVRRGPPGRTSLPGVSGSALMGGR